jgi:raffinose/stachyose/melibiose transport system permease protein
VVATEAPRVSTASSEPEVRPQQGRAVSGRPISVRVDRIWVLGAAAPALALYALFVLWPLIQVGWIALQRWNGYGPQVFIGLANFADLAGDAVFRTGLAHSLLWEAGAIVLVTAAGLGLALLIRAGRPGPAPTAALFFPALLPPAVVAAVWTLVYTPISGLLNTALRAVGLGTLQGDWLGDPHLALPALFAAWAWASLGIGTLIFCAGLGSIGREYIEVALVEGAGPLWRFRHVLLPGLRRSGLVAVLINAALAGQVFDLIYVTTGGGPGYATMILPIDMYGRAFGGATGQGAAVAVTQVLLGLVLVVLAAVVVRGPAEGLAGEEGEPAPTYRAGRWAAIGLLALALIVLLAPLAWLLVVALGGGGVTIGSTAGWDPRTWAWDSFGSAWNAGLGGAVETSVLLAAGAVTLTAMLAVPAAFALARAGTRLRLAALALLAIGLFQPTPVLIIPLFSLLRNLGLLDSAWGVLLPEVARSLPFAVLLLVAFLRQLPAHVLEAAEVDGASPGQQMLHIALPLVRPALIAAAVWAFVTSWNEYLLPTIVSQDGSLSPVPALLAGFIGRYNTQYAVLAAGSLIALAPPLVLYLVLRRPAAVALRSAGRRMR